MSKSPSKRKLPRGKILKQLSAIPEMNSPKMTNPDSEAGGAPFVFGSQPSVRSPIFSDNNIIPLESDIEPVASQEVKTR